MKDRWFHVQLIRMKQNIIQPESQSSPVLILIALVNPVFQIRICLEIVQS